MLLYILGLGSPTHPLSARQLRAGWPPTEWEHSYGYDYLYCGSLFTHQLSHIWIDFRGIQDGFMREKGIDYFENSRRATYVQQQYALDNPLGFAGYGDCCWGITASDGPGPAILDIDGTRREFFDYVARGAPHGPDDGTVAPWAVVASLPFAPEIVLPAIDHLVHEIDLKAGNPYGFKSTFNATYPVQFRQPARLGLALALRHQRGPGGADDRELPQRTAMAPDARLPLHRRWPAARRLHRRPAGAALTRCALSAACGSGLSRS